MFVPHHFHMTFLYYGFSEIHMARLCWANITIVLFLKSLIIFFVWLALIKIGQYVFKFLFFGPSGHFGSDSHNTTCHLTYHFGVGDPLFSSRRIRRCCSHLETVEAQISRRMLELWWKQASESEKLGVVGWQEYQMSYHCGGAEYGYIVGKV